MKIARPSDNEKGFVLILALIVMFMMTIIGLSAITNTTTDIQLSRNDRESRQAFQYAEAGIREGSARLRLPSTNARYIGAVSTDAGYMTTAWNTDTSCSGKNFGSACAGAKASADGLTYDVVIRYLDENNNEGLCDSNNVGTNSAANATVPPASCQKSPAEVVMYGQDFNFDSTVTSTQYGNVPIYKMTSVGTVNGTQKTVIAYVAESNLNVDTTSALNTNACVTVSGGSNTITGGTTQGAGCACDASLSGGCLPNKTTVTDMNTYLGDTLANIATIADQTLTCVTATCNGAGDNLPANGDLTGSVTNWGEAASSPSGGEGVLLYVNNSGGNAVKISGNVIGEGILIVTGDLTISGNVTWEGLIYVMGTLTVSGSVNVKGGVMSNSTVQLNGSVTATYNLEELQEMARQTSSSSTTVWKRL